MKYLWRKDTIHTYIVNYKQKKRVFWILSKITQIISPRISVFFQIAMAFPRFTISRSFTPPFNLSAILFINIFTVNLWLFMIVNTRKPQLEDDVVSLVCSST